MLHLWLGSVILRLFSYLNDSAIRRLRMIIYGKNGDLAVTDGF